MLRELTKIFSHNYGTDRNDSIRCAYPICNEFLSTLHSKEKQLIVRVLILYTWCRQKTLVPDGESSAVERVAVIRLAAEHGIIQRASFSMAIVLIAAGLGE